MAIYKRGGPGGLNGKLGNTVTYELLGKQVLRMNGVYNGPRSEKQLENELGMTLISHFLNKVKPFVDRGLGPLARATGMYPVNMGVKLNKPAALSGLYPDLEIDYARVILSKGRLPGLPGLSVSLLAGASADEARLCFNWDVPAGLSWPRTDDQVMLCAFLPDVDTKLHSQAYLKTGPVRRTAGYDELVLPAVLSTERMAIWAAMVSDERKSVSDSQVYLLNFTASPP